MTTLAETQQVEPKKPAQCAIEAFGGVRALARAVGVSPDIVSRWRSRCDGFIPRQQAVKIYQLARDRGLELTAEDLLIGRTA